MLAITVQEANVLPVSAASEPRPVRGEVVVRVALGGICGSDVHILHGSNPFAHDPRVIGHEIVALGEGVGDVHVGDRVVADPVVACGHCHPCRVGRPNVCANLEVIGVHRDGGFCSLMTLPAANAVRISDDLTFAAGDARAAFDLVEQHPERTLKVQTAFGGD